MRVTVDLGDRVEPGPPVQVDGRRVLRPNHKLQPREIDLLVADYWATVCLTELGLKYSLHRQTAKAYLERRGVPNLSEVPTMMPGQVQAAGQLYEASGLSLAQVAVRFEVAPNTLRRAIGASWLSDSCARLRPPRSRQRGCWAPSTDRRSGTRDVQGVTWSFARRDRVMLVALSDGAGRRRTPSSCDVLEDFWPCRSPVNPRPKTSSSISTRARSVPASISCRSFWSPRSTKRPS